MKAKNTNVMEMEKVLEVINRKYEGNIIWKRFDDGKIINFTLTVKNSRNKGGRVSREGRSIAAACWHVHGDFFDALFEINPKAVIVSMGNKIDINSGNWQDRNIGSMMHPFMYSESCECN